MTLRNIDSQVLKLQRKHVQRLAVNVLLLGAGDISTIKLDNVNVKITLKRGGVDRVIAHENLLLLAVESMYFNNIETPLAGTAITVDASTKLLPLIIDLGAVINLFGEDELTVEMVTKTGWFGTFDSNSIIEFEERPAVGVEYFIPFIKTKAVQASVARMTESLGDNVTSIALINLEAGKDGSFANRVFDNFVITSDKYNISDNRERLLGRRSSQFETLATGMARGENFKYVPNAALDNTQLTLELNGGNVVATKNYILYRTFEGNAATVKRGEAVRAKHKKRDAQKYANSN